MYFKEREQFLIAQRIALAPAALGYLAVAGYVFGVRALYSLPGFGSVSLITAVAVALLAGAMLAHTYAVGFMRIITASDAGGEVARRLLPVTLVLPFAIEGLRTLIERSSSRAGAAFAVLAYAAIGTSLVLKSSQRVGQSDRDRQAAAAALQKANTQLRIADGRKDEFLATLAHELRNPLAPIRSAAMVLKAAATEEKRGWAIQVIDRQVRSMARLLEDLLDVSRITRGQLNLQKQRVSLISIIDHALELARPTIDARRHQLEVNVTSELIELEADPVRLAQAFCNLLTNAAKYTDRGGRIELTALYEAHQVRITVKDTGIGLERHSLSEVFQMFSQVRTALERSEGGLGIGLALVKGVVELHGGRVEACSAGLGQGSEFVVHLPIAAIAPTPEDANDEETLVGQGTSRRVLIADDNVDGAHSLAQWLELDGHTTYVAHDGLTAIEAIEREQPEIGLIDIGMPGLNGYEVAQRVRASAMGKKIRLIALTGWAQEDDKRRALTAGFDRHLTKPVDPLSLRALFLNLEEG